LGAFYQIGLAQTVTQNEFIEGSKELTYPDVYNKQDLDLPFYSSKNRQPAFQNELAKKLIRELHNSNDNDD